MQRRDKKRLLIYAGIALIASGIILMILLYGLVYLHPVKILLENNKTVTRNQTDTLSNDHMSMKLVRVSAG